jgi:UDP-N-acetylmuramoyl-tripeptide--D-alanyl-D-alanine ligase
LLFGFSLFGFREILFPSIPFANIYLNFFEFFVGIPFLVLILYIFEAFYALFSFLQKKLKKPVLTKKSAFLSSTALILEILLIVVMFLYFKDEFGYINFITVTFYLLLFDIFTPLIISAIVLLFQPLAFLAKNRVIKRAKEKRDRFANLLVVGITGSYGKTSTKEFLFTILAEKYKVLKTKKHQNSEIGVAQCVLNELGQEHEIFIAEMGAYNKGGIKLLAEITKPKIAIITGVNEQHLALFGSRENLMSAEGGKELIEALPKDGVAILNGDNEKLKTKKNEIKNFNSNLKKIIYCSTREKMDFWAEDLKTEKEWIYFKAFSQDGDWAEFKVNLLGIQNVQNILLATAVAKELGMGLGEIAKTCQKIILDQGAMKLKKGISGLNIIDSTYSANPDGVIADLEYLKVWEGKKVIIMPCLIELGEVSGRVHRKIGQKIGEICDLAIITTKERFAQIRQGALENGMPKENIIFLEKPKDIFEKVKNFNGENDIILLEGRLPQTLLKILTKSALNGRL